MATTKDDKSDASVGASIAKYLMLFLMFGLVVLLIIFGLKFWLIYSVYIWCLDRIAAPFALDMIWTRLIAVLATGTIVLVLPTLFSFFFLGRHKKPVLIGLMVAFTAFTFVLHYGTKDVLFTPDGQPAKYYLKTLDGFKFSSTERFDPQFGARYKPITPEVAKEYWFWQKYGKNENMPTLVPGKYFDQPTGEAIVWYAERADGQIELFSLPGYDPKTGKALKPMTEEVAGRASSNQTDTKKFYRSTNNENLIGKIAEYLKDKNVFVINDTDLDWYYSANEYMPIERQHVALNRSYVNFFGNQTLDHLMDVRVEKLFFVPPSYCIIGLYVRSYTTTYLPILGSFEISNKQYEPIRIITDIKKDFGLFSRICTNGSELNLAEGNIFRVVYIIEYSNFGDIDEGVFKSTNGIYSVPFSRKL
jgi:hypothetical protein